MSSRPLTPDPSSSGGEESERRLGQSFREALRRPTSRVRRTLRWTRRLVLALLLPLVSLAAFGQWWLLPRLNDYRDDLAGALRDYLQVPVRIEAVTAVRDGWRLGLRLRGISLHDPNRDAALASFAQAAATLNLWRSLREWRPVFSRLRLEGANLTLEQGPDGIPRLLATAGAVESAPPLPEVARWLFGLRRLEIVGERLALRGRDGAALQLSHPYLRLQETPHGQRLTFTAELPASPGHPLRFTMERQRPDSADPERGQGTFHLRADPLDLAGWPSPIPFASGQVDLDLRGDWQDWQPIRLEGELRLRRAMVNREPRFALLEPWLAKMPESEFRFDGQREETGWRVRSQARLVGDGKEPSVIRPTFDLNRTDAGWRVHIRDLRAEDLLAWLTPWLDESARRWLVPLEPRGELPEITVRAEPTTGFYAATARMRDVAFRPVHGLPGFDHVTGTVEFGPDHGQIELDSRKVRVDTAGLLRAPVTLDTLTGTVSWQHTAAGLRLESGGLDLANPDLGGRFWGSVSVPDDDEPVLDVRGQYRDVKVRQARRYLPVAVIPPEGVAWLDRALIDGRVVSGDLIFRGPPARFPFDRNEGLFETRFQVEDAMLDYAPGWPRLERARASVQFRNRGLRVDAGRGRLLDAEMEGGVARIDDLAAPVIQVNGRARGPGASLWRTLKDSPVGRELGEDLPDLRVSGASTLDLELTLPTDSSPGRVRGRVGLLENRVILPAWNVELGQVRGEVRFTEADLEARDVQASLRGEPIRLDLGLAGREDRRELRTRLRGRLGFRALAGEPAAVLEPYVNGKSGWEAILVVPTQRRERGGEAPPFSLELNSDLRGIAIRLPVPLGKVADEARPLKIAVHPRERDALDLMLEYGADVRAALELSDFSSRLRLERGELRIDAGAARLPDAPGLTVVAHLSRWEPTLPAAPPDPSSSALPPAGRQPAPAGRAPEAPNGFGNGLRHLEARIDHLVLAGQSFAGVTLRAARERNGLRVELDSKTLAGRVTVPDRPAPEQPVDVALRRLYLHRATDDTPRETDASEMDPRRLPPLVLAATELRLDDATLGQLRLVAMPHVGGIRLTEFELNSAQQRISASGEWWRTIGGQVSRLRARLESQALGATLAALGYPATGIARGETRAELVAEWAAALPDFALELLEGTLKLEVGPGQLLDVDPGVGRMVGLFNLQNLMRRLTLDFSDLFQPGMSFDRISGELIFKGGQAYTDNLTIEAPAARIQIQGRTGLKERDYEHRVTVTPQFGGALPVAGAIAGGPAVGAAVLLAERLLQKGIENVTRYRYALTGSWDRPTMKLLEEPQPAGTTKGLTGDR